MTLKAQLYWLVALLHITLLLAAYVYIDKPGIEFLALELFIALSALLFILLIRKALSPLQYLNLFKDTLQEQQYNVRFSQTNAKELDELMVLFNQMLQQLYQQRLKLGDREGMLQQLMNAMPSAIIVFDYNGGISGLNPAAEQLLGVTLKQVVSKKLISTHHVLSEQLEQLAANQSQLISDRAGKRYRCQRSNFRDRGFDRQFIIITEITGDLHSSEKNTYNKLIRLMSHEVNNTMAATGSLLKSCLYYTDQIDPNERDDYRTAMELVIERTDNLNQFMQDFANMVRLPEPSLELCNLHHLLLSMSKLFAVQLKANAIELKLTAPPQQCLVMADRNQLEQVLINVIKNAMEAISAQDVSGQIDIELYIELGQQRRWCLTIKDTGAGLSDASAQDIFTPFFSTKAEGQGLGLMLVRDILAAHQLEFTLQNRQPPEPTGACFIVKFDMNDHAG